MNLTIGNRLISRLLLQGLHFQRTFIIDPTFYMVIVSKNVCKSSLLYNPLSTSSRQNPNKAVFQKREKVDQPKHLEQISDILNCSVKRVQFLSLKHDFLYNMNLNNLHERVQLMLSYGLPYSFIHINLRAVYYVSTESLRQRLELMKKNSLLDYRYLGFYLYCTKKEFEQGLNYVSKNREALDGCVDQLEYVKHHLKVSENVAKKFISSGPFKRGYSPVRLKNQIDFFRDEAKLSSDFLIKNYILMNYSVERLRMRLKIMEEAGITEPSLMRTVWCYTPKKFVRKFSDYIPNS